MTRITTSKLKILMIHGTILILSTDVITTTDHNYSRQVILRLESFSAKKYLTWRRPLSKPFQQRLPLDFIRITRMV